MCIVKNLKHKGGSMDTALPTHRQGQSGLWYVGETTGPRDNANRRSSPHGSRERPWEMPQPTRPGPGLQGWPPVGTKGIVSSPHSPTPAVCTRRATRKALTTELLRDWQERTTTTKMPIVNHGQTRAKEAPGDRDLGCRFHLWGTASSFILEE